VRESQLVMVRHAPPNLPESNTSELSGLRRQVNRQKAPLAPIHSGTGVAAVQLASRRQGAQYPDRGTQLPRVRPTITRTDG
jgi:hypothetical protein